MTDFKDFAAGNKKMPQLSPPLEIDGAFDCTICHEHVEVAEFFSEIKLLRWTCGLGHVSTIEEFSL